MSYHRNKWTISRMAAVFGALAGLAVLSGCGGASEAAPAPATSRSALVAVSGGVRLHYLDWGSGKKNDKRETLLFLPGLGDNAYVFSDLAPRFAKRYRVLALTRRGFGDSDQPNNGYDVDTLARDIKDFLDALSIDRVHIIGHSIAGNEMTRLAALYPERVGRLVYLDAAFDRSAQSGPQAASVEEELMPPAPTPEDFASLEAAAAFLRRTSTGVWSDALMNNLRHAVTVLPDGSVQPRTPDAITSALMLEAGKYRAEYEKVKSPALAIYAVPGTIYHLFPWLEGRPLSDEARSIAEATMAGNQQLQALHAAQFEQQVQKGRALLPANTVHYLFIQRAEEIAEQIEAFLRDK